MSMKGIRRGISVLKAVCSVLMNMGKVLYTVLIQSRSAHVLGHDSSNEMD